MRYSTGASVVKYQTAETRSCFCMQLKTVVYWLRRVQSENSEDLPRFEEEMVWKLTQETHICGDTEEEEFRKDAIKATIFMKFEANLIV